MVDPHQAVETEWKEVKAFIIEKGLLKKGVSVFEFWRPIIQQPILFPNLHVILRCALALSPTSCDVERLFSLLNRINSHDRRTLGMDQLEKLLVVARDAVSWSEYDFSQVVQRYRQKRRVRVIRQSRKDKGKRRKIDMDLEAQDSSADSEEELAPMTFCDKGDEGPAMTYSSSSSSSSDSGSSSSSDSSSDSESE